MATTNDRAPDAIAEPHASAVAEVLRILRSLAFGSIELTVHDSRVVQIERRERIRFDHGRPAR